MRSGMGAGTGEVKAMGATMQGFKLDDDSSEEDLDAIPIHLQGRCQKRIDKKQKQITTWRQENIAFKDAFLKGKLRS